MPERNLLVYAARISSGLELFLAVKAKAITAKNAKVAKKYLCCVR